MQLDPQVEEVVLSQNRKETECSACGRFIGSWEICPFCRHYNPKRWQVRLIKYSMPFLTILGLLLLAWLGRICGTAQVKIAELGRKANFAQVVLHGVVSDDIRFHAGGEDSGPSSKSLEFSVDDGSGVIRIRCYEDAYEELLAENKIPGFGDRVRLTGNYQYKAKRHFVILGSPGDLIINREKPAEALPIRTAARMDERAAAKDFARVKVTGLVRSKSFGAYDWVWRLEDPSGSVLPVKMAASMLDAYGAGHRNADFCRAIQEGDFVTCYGVLQWNRSREGRFWQLIPAAPDDFEASNEHAWKQDNAAK